MCCPFGGSAHPAAGSTLTRQCHRVSTKCSTRAAAERRRSRRDKEPGRAQVKPTEQSCQLSSALIGSTFYPTCKEQGPCVVQAHLLVMCLAGPSARSTTASWMRGAAAGAGLSQTARLAHTQGRQDPRPAATLLVWLAGCIAVEDVAGWGNAAANCAMRAPVGRCVVLPHRRCAATPQVPACSVAKQVKGNGRGSGCCSLLDGVLQTACQPDTLLNTHLHRPRHVWLKKRSPLQLLSHALALLWPMGMLSVQLQVLCGAVVQRLTARTRRSVEG